MSHDRGIARETEHEDRQGPEQDADGGGHRQPAPQTEAGDAVGGQRHEGEIDHERPGLRIVRRDEKRASHGAEKPERGERRAVQGGGHHGQDRDEAQEHEGRRGPISS
jgi:hypothetical protein